MQTVIYNAVLIKDNRWCVCSRRVLVLRGTDPPYALAPISCPTTALTRAPACILQSRQPCSHSSPGP